MSAAGQGSQSNDNSSSDSENENSSLMPKDNTNASNSNSKTSSSDGKMPSVPLKDVAQVSVGDERTSISKTNGKDAVNLQIIKLKMRIRFKSQEMFRKSGRIC